MLKRATQEVASLVSEGYIIVAALDSHVFLRHPGNKNRARVMVGKKHAWLIINDDVVKVF